MLTFFTHSADETTALGYKIGKKHKKGDIIAMQGTLAAGKTTITKGIAQALDISEEITSPTFCLISELYGNMPLYHMDVYRLDGTEDFINLGVDDMLYGDGVCIIEWSDNIKDILPKNRLEIKIKVIDENKRSLTINAYGKEYEELCEAVL